MELAPRFLRPPSSPGGRGRASRWNFVVYGPDGFWAIEVKNSREVRPSDLRGLMSFAADYPEAEPLLLYRGDRALQKGPVRCLPVEEFLLALGPDRPLT